MESLQIGAAIRFGWENFKKHFLFLWTLFGIVWGVSFALDLLQKGAGKETLLGMCIGLAAIAVGIVLQLGLIRVYLDLANGTQDKIQVLFSEYRLAWRYFGAALLYGIMIVVGLVLFIVPGIYFGLKYQFYSYLIIDKNLGIMDALKKSAEMTKGIKWDLFGFLLVLCGLNFLGALVFFVGLLVTVPVSIMAYVFVYQSLVKNSFKDALISENTVLTNEEVK